MKINKRSIRKSAIAAVVTVLLGIASSCTDLWSEQHPGTFYISDGKTIATFLEEYEGNIFSDFIKILKRNIDGSSYWGELKTYGDRTLFAPTNAAIKEYLEDRRNIEKDPSKKWYFDNVDNLPDSIVDSIRKTHLCKESIFLDDLRKNKDWSLPSSNMLDRILTYEAIEDTSDASQIRVAYKINKYSRIIEADDSTVNGVVHIIDKVIRQSTEYIPGYLRLNNEKADRAHKATIFLQALELTRLSSELERYRDLRYKPVQYDSTFACLEMTQKVAVEYETGYQNKKDQTQQRAVWPTERLFKYTLFVVSDSILDCVYGITDIDKEGEIGKYTGNPGKSLKAYAKEIYGTPDELTHLNDDDSLSTSPLYKLISYHILPCWLRRDRLNYNQKAIIDNYKGSGCPDSMDMEDFYETLHPHAVMRISTPYDVGGKENYLGETNHEGTKYNGTKIFINRKGTQAAGNLTAEGIRIWGQEEVPELNTEDAMNGGYYYIDSILAFDSHTINNALNTRMRFMGATLSPDFINSGARGRYIRTDGNKNPTTFACYCFKEGFCKNFSASDQTLYAVRYLDTEWDIMYHDELNVVGICDLTFRLPPVPKNGLYEIRIFGNAQAAEQYRKTRGIVQFYFGIGNDGDNIYGNIAWDPCDIPVNFSTLIDIPDIGYVKDKDIKGDTPEEHQLLVQANDKAMRNRGWMKAPASFGKSGTSLRNDEYCFRKIITTRTMNHDGDYFLRMRQVTENANSIVPINFIEIVPKSIFAGETPEDIY